MSKQLLAAFCIFSFSYCFGQVKQEPESSILLGKPKAMTEKEYKFQKQLLVLWKSKEYSTVYKYDDQNRETEAFCNKRGKKLDYSTKFVYDANGFRIGETILDGSGVKIGRSEFKYDANGHQIEHFEYDVKDSLLSKAIFTYDGAGHQTKVQFVEGVNGTKGYYCVNQFNDKGQKTLESYYGGNDSLEFKVSYTYDDKNRESGSIYYNPDGSVDLNETYKYVGDDAKGNWTKRMTYENGKKVHELKRKIEY